MTNKSNFWTDTDIGLLIIRVSLGAIIFFHGFHKLMHGINDLRLLFDGDRRFLEQFPC